MSRLDDFVDRTLVSAGRMSGRAVATVALLLYAVGGLALPIVLGAFLGWLNSVLVIAVMNFYFTMMAGLVILAWVMEQREAGERRRERDRDRRHLLDWTTDLRRLRPEEFEWLVGELFRREGWNVQEGGRQDAPDGNIDLELSREGQHMIVQCKRRTRKPADVHEIREFIGTLARENLPMTAGIFVTLSRFTEYARAEAEAVGITCVDNRALHDRIEKVRRPEPCPDCQSSMILGHNSTWGWWFRCIAPGCSGKRHLGKDPMRALEFLTQPPPERT